jgi:DNA polymerase-1
MHTYNYNLIDTDNKLKDLISVLNNQDRFAFDLESNSLDTHALDTLIVGISFCFKENEAYYIPFNLPKSEEFTYSYSDLIEIIKEPLTNSSIKKIGHNIKFDCRLLNRFGINVKNIYFDTIVAAYNIYSDRLNLNLDDLTLHHFNYIKVRTKTLIPKKSKTNPNPSMLDSPIKDVAFYGCEDVDFTYKLFLLFNDMLKQPEFAYAKSVFYELDMPLVSVLINMECNGIKIDEDRLALMRDDLCNQLKEIQEKINFLAGREIILTNPTDLSKLLFEERKVQEKFNKPILKTSTGRNSTSLSTLEEYKGDEVVDTLLEYKALAKIISTYVMVLPDYISRHTGYMHPFFTQTRTSTGRLASSDPNVQNIPARTSVGKKIRSVFVSRYPGGLILAADYSQAELRILAHASEEPVFINAYRNNEDIHRAVASEVVYQKPRNEVTDSERTIIKTVNFGLMYGMRPKKLAATLNISVETSQDIMDKYMNKMSGLKDFLDQARVTAKKLGYTETLFGRRRFVSKIYSENQMDQWAAEREAANHIIQGTNADIVKKAMILIDEMIESRNLKSKLILQVHDEVVLDVHPDEISFMKDEVCRIMQEVVNFKVTMKAEGKYAQNWAEAH